MLTPGQAHDLACAEELIEASDPDALIADKAFDADPFIATLNERAITPVIPPKVNRKIQRPCDFALYCERNLIERFFNKLKHYRAVATCYDKLARNLLAGVPIPLRGAPYRKRHNGLGPDASWRGRLRGRRAPVG